MSGKIEFSQIAVSAYLKKKVTFIEMELQELNDKDKMTGGEMIIYFGQEKRRELLLAIYEDLFGVAP